MLTIKKRFYFNKMYAYGAGLFFAGFVGSQAILTTIAPRTTSLDAAYVAYTADKKSEKAADKEVAPVVRDVSSAGDQAAQPAVQGGSVFAPTKQTHVAPAQQPATGPSQPTAPTTTAPAPAPTPAIPTPEVPVVEPPADEPGDDTPPSDDDGIIDIIDDILNP